MAKQPTNPVTQAPETFRCPYRASELDDFLADASALASRYGTKLEVVVEAAKALEMMRANERRAAASLGAHREPGHKQNGRDPA